MTDQDRCGLASRFGGERADQGRFADARITPDEREMTLPTFRGCQQDAEPLPLSLPPDQAGRRQRSSRGRNNGS
jgi:hypothetical protein